MKLVEFKNPDKIVYADINEFADNFGKETGISDLREKIEAFKANPTKDGEVLKGTKRTFTSKEKRILRWVKLYGYTSASYTKFIACIGPKMIISNKVL